MKKKMSQLSLDVFEHSSCFLEKHYLSAGTHFPTHWHKCIEIEFVISGSGNHYQNDISYAISPGSCYMLSEQDFHSITAHTDLALYCLSFSRNILPNELRQYVNMNNIFCQFGEGQRDWILQLFEHLSEESASSAPFSQMAENNILFQIFIQIIRETHLMPPSVFVSELLSYVNENYQRPLTLKELASQFGFSPNYLGQLFKNQTGQSFNDYLMATRLQHACRLLSNPAFSIKECAMESGFQSVEYFFHIFRRKKAMTPCEYRERILESGSTPPHIHFLAGQ